MATLEQVRTGRRLKGPDKPEPVTGPEGRMPDRLKPMYAVTLEMYEAWAEFEKSPLWEWMLKHAPIAHRHASGAHYCSAAEGSVFAPMHFPPRPNRGFGYPAWSAPGLLDGEWPGEGYGKHFVFTATGRRAQLYGIAMFQNLIAVGDGRGLTIPMFAPDVADNRRDPYAEARRNTMFYDYANAPREYETTLVIDGAKHWTRELRRMTEQSADDYAAKFRKQAEDAGRVHGLKQSVSNGLRKLELLAPVEAGVCKVKVEVIREMKVTEPRVGILTWVTKVDVEVQSADKNKCRCRTARRTLTGLLPADEGKISNFKVLRCSSPVCVHK